MKASKDLCKEPSRDLMGLEMEWLSEVLGQAHQDWPRTWRLSKVYALPFCSLFYMAARRAEALPLFGPSEWARQDG